MERQVARTAPVGPTVKWKLGTAAAVVFIVVAAVFGWPSIVIAAGVGVAATLVARKVGQSFAPGRGLMRMVMVVGIGAYAALLAFAVHDLIHPDSVAGGACPSPTAAQTPHPERMRAMTTLTATGSGSDDTPSTISLTMGRQRRLITNAQLFSVQGRKLRLDSAVYVGTSSFVRDDGTELPPGSVVASAVAVTTDRVELSVCFNPAVPVGQAPAVAAATTARSAAVTTAAEPTAARVDPGRYSGRVIFFDDRTQRLEVPVDVTMQFGHWPILLVLFVTILPFASYVVFAGREESAPLRIETFRRWGTWMRDSPVAIGGAVAAAFGVLVNQYFSDPAWSGRLKEALTLTVAVGGAFVTALTVVAAGVKATTPPSRAVDSGQAPEIEG